ncbi:hypothetical protein [Alteromonas sp. A079]|uniref:hypothetical protein n=1 Tax=Alteromonas sp. A079 TaxID=3410268 RepID=UPI003B9E66F6
MALPKTKERQGKLSKSKKTTLNQTTRELTNKRQRSSGESNKAQKLVIEWLRKIAALLTMVALVQQS